MANINNYGTSALKVNDKLLASDGDTGATKNISPEDVAELNGGVAIYRAVLTQTSTNAPIAVVLGPNTIGNIVWTRTTTGIYVGTLANAFQGYPVLITGEADITRSVKVNNTSSNTFSIATYISGSLSDGALSNQFIEIRVYNV
jgi:hypothetical protein